MRATDEASWLVLGMFCEGGSTVGTEHRAHRLEDWWHAVLEGSPKSKFF